MRGETPPEIDTADQSRNTPAMTRPSGLSSVHLSLLATALFACSFAAPAAAKEKEKGMRMAVLPARIQGTTGVSAQQAIEQRLPIGLRAARVDVITGAPVATALGSENVGKPCDEGCVKRVARGTTCRYVAGADIRAEPPFYQIHLWVADSHSGKVLATVNVKCDVCPPAALGNKVELAASQLATALRARAKKPAVLVIVSDPPGAEVLLDDKPQGQTPARLRVKAGAHLLEVRAEGYITERKDVIGVAGVEETVKVALIPKAKAKPSNLKKILGWTAIGVGVASIVAGAVLLSMDGDGVDCQTGQARDICAKTRNTAAGGWVLLGAGVASAGAGTALLLWPSGSKSERSALKSSPRLTIGPAGLGLRLGGTF